MNTRAIYTIIAMFMLPFPVARKAHASTMIFPMDDEPLCLSILDERCTQTSLDDVSGEHPVYLDYFQPTLAKFPAILPSTIRFLTVPYTVEAIPDKCFLGCATLSYIDFGEASSVKSFGANSFRQSGLLQIHIPASVEQIGDRCFASCRRLSRVTFHRSASLKRIGVYAFFECSIGEIEIPNSVEEICGHWLSRCGSLVRITFGESCSLKRIGYPVDRNWTSDGCSVTELRIPDCIEEICNGCFYGCQQLMRVTFGEHSLLKRIGCDAFAGVNFANRLTRITIPDGVEEIGDSCFFCCTNLARVSFGESSVLKRIGCDAFSGYSKGCAFTEIEIPDTVEELGGACFGYCRSLSHVIFGRSPSLKRIGPCCFSNSGLVRFSIPARVESIGGGAFCECPMNEGFDCGENDRFCVWQNLLLSKNGRTCYSSICVLTQVVIPARVRHICECCFYNCMSLTQVTLEKGSSLRSIGLAGLGDSMYIPSTVWCQLPWRCKLSELSKSWFYGKQRPFSDEDCYNSRYIWFRDFSEG